MKRVAFKMTILPDYRGEYQKRHDEIWPELKALLKDAGISEYSIFMDEESNTLFAFLKVDNQQLLVDLAAQPVMQRWWSYMSDISVINPDNSPVVVPLKEVFYLD